MTEEEKDDIKQLAEHIQTKVNELNETMERPCWLCEKEIKNWICILPENGTDGLGLGTTSGKMRMAFIPLCPEHDINDKEVLNKLKVVLKFKSQALRN